MKALLAMTNEKFQMKNGKCFLPGAHCSLLTAHCSLLTAHGANRCRYSIEVMNALTISALTKLPLKSFNLANQKL